MRRLRITFVLLGLVLLAPLSLLLLRAWQGLERERDALHELVASRVFDESERALGELLRDEQSRPAEHYLNVSASGAPSPLASTPSAEFVLGYFEVDRNGQISIPSAREPDLLRTQVRAVLPQLSPGLADFSDELRAGADKQRRAEVKRAKALPIREEQAPGSTRLLQKVDPLKGTEKLEEKELALEPQAPAPQSKDSDLSSYSMIERLNLGARKRSLAEPEAPASTSMLSSSAPASAPAPPPPAVEPTVAAAEALGRTDAADAGPDLEQDFARESSSPLAAADERGAGARVAGAARSEDKPKRSANVVVSEPARPQPPALRTSLQGLIGSDGRLILHRTVLRGGANAVEQGLVVDLPRLASWLESGVLGASGLRPYLDLDFALGSASPAPLASDRFVYEHRFQEPFAALSARLSVAPLPEESSADYLYALGALLVLASTAGLWAVYRRVAAAVHFSERRSNFAAAVSHELKTPLTAIRMYAEMLRDGMVPDDATRRSYLDTITSESERLTRLINNVLEFSRLERRAQDLALVSETPLPALRAALRTLEPHARAQGFALCEQSSDPLPAALHDRDALQQILFNLIDNALKYARRAERKEIEIACGPCAGGVAVRVRDFGPGVAREHQPHLFEPFYRGGDELTRQTQGTGIGLALVRELAQRMGAEVSAQNCADGGFAVELRLRSA